MNSNEYFEQKKLLLKECVALSEEMLSNISDIVAVNKLLELREEKILLLQKLDGDNGKAMMDSLPEERKSHINQLVSLLQSLDRDTAKKITDEQNDLKKSMKVNAQNHKLINYKAKQEQTSGRLLDKKK